MTVHPYSLPRPSPVFKMLATTSMIAVFVTYAIVGT